MRQDTRVQQAMWLVRWLQEGDSSMPIKPDEATASLNEEVRKAQEQVQRQKRWRYNHYDDETHVKVEKYSRDNWNKAAASKFSAELGHVVTVRTMKELGHVVTVRTMK